MNFSEKTPEMEVSHIRERRHCNYQWLGSPEFMNQIRVLEDIDFLLGERDRLTAERDAYRRVLEKIEQTNKNGPRLGMSDYKIRNQMEDMAIAVLYHFKESPSQIVSKKDG